MTTDVIYLWGREEKNEKKGGLRIFKIITILFKKDLKIKTSFGACIFTIDFIVSLPSFHPPSFPSIFPSFLPSLVEPTLFIYTFCILVCQ